MGELIDKGPLSPTALLDQDAERDKLSAYFIEYQALRTEIEWLLRDATQYQNFAIALLAGVLGAIGFVLDKLSTLIVPALLTIPFMFCLLGFLYFRQHEEVFVIAAYLREYVRPRVRSLTRDNALWGWEEFKARRGQQIYVRNLFKMLSSNRMVLALRTLLFLAPGILSLLVVIGYATSLGIYGFVSTYSTILSALFAIWFLFDCVIISVFIIYLWSQGDLPRRVLRLEDLELEGSGKPNDKS